MGVQRNTGQLSGRGDWEEEAPMKKANEALVDHQRKRKVDMFRYYLVTTLSLSIAGIIEYGLMVSRHPLVMPLFCCPPPLASQTKLIVLLRLLFI